MVIDMTGQKYGRLTILNRVDNDKHGNAMWLCKCKCGKQIIIRGSCIRSGNTTSCGCYHRDKFKEVVKEVHEFNRKTNTYIQKDDYYIGYTVNGKEFYFDIDDYNIVKQYRWNIDKYGYIKTVLKNNNHYKTILLHRLIMDCPNNLYVDHINHHKNDNRKKNLRICTKQENNRNRMVSKNNSSGTTGVYYNKGINKWIAYIMVDRKQIYIGSFDLKEDAIQARLNEQDKLFKEFSYKKDNKTT